MTGVPVLEVSDVWKVFGQSRRNPWSATANLDDAQLHARGLVAGVREATFTVERGEIFVIMGLSGSGKSTLLRCLTALQPVSAGSIKIGGVDLSTASASALVQLRRTQISMVFQSFALLPHLDALDNVAFPLRVRGVNRQERRRLAIEALALVGLAGKEKRLPRELSGGQQQRVGIARSLVTDPEVWFLDEPFSALDPLIRKEMQNEFLRLQDQLQKTIVFVTHDLEEAVRLGDRIAIMAEGRILQVGTPEDLILNPATDYIARFVAGIPKSRVVRAGSVAVASDDTSTDEPVAADACLSDIAARVILSDRPIGVVDAAGRRVGTISRRELAPWLT